MKDVSLYYIKKIESGKYHIIRHIRLIPVKSLHQHRICRTLCGIDAMDAVLDDYIPTIPQLCKTCIKLSYN